MTDLPTLRVAFSPCPNDTFMFHAIASGALAMPTHTIDIHLDDVETLNHCAVTHTYDVSKLSFYAYLKLKHDYHMLESGAALGYGCGPLVVARQESQDKRPPDCSIAIPGNLTTAHLLLQLWAPETHRTVCMPFDTIMPAVLDGQVDWGVIIHEGRFTYNALGLKKVVDLGEWWQRKTSLPLPLGCIAIKRSIDETTRVAFDALLRDSIDRAVADPAATMDYVRHHAQAMEEAVLEAHIKTYVNDFSRHLTPRGHEAVARLETEARRAGVLP